MKVLIPFNVKNSNGRTYSEDSFKSLPTESLLEANLDFHYPASTTVCFENVIGKIENIKVDKSCLVGEPTFLTNEKGKIFENLVKENCFAIRPRLIGFVDKETGKVNNAEILSFFLVPCENDSF